SAEHQVINGNRIMFNGIGLYAPSGNCVIIGNKIIGNNYGIVLFGGPNSTHGEGIGNTLNHNNYGIVAQAAIAEEIRNNLFLDVNSIHIYAVGYVVFDGNQFRGAPGMNLTVTNSSWAAPTFVTISHNCYEGVWGTDFVVTTNLGTGTGATYIYGNRSLT